MKAKTKRSLALTVKIILIIAVLSFACVFFLVYYGFEYIFSISANWCMVEKVTPELTEMVTGYLSENGLPKEARIIKVAYKPYGENDGSEPINIFIEIPNDSESIGHLMQKISMPPGNNKIAIAKDAYGKINPVVFHNEIIERNKDSIVVEAYREAISHEIVNLGHNIGFTLYDYPPKLPEYPIYLIPIVIAFICILLIILTIRKSKR